MPEVQLRGAEVDGLTIHYVSEGRGPAVILLHGLGGFAESWRHNISALARVATVYAVDLPGFGQSSKPPARYRLADSARAVHGFVQAMGLGRVAIVGHSLGELLALCGCAPLYRAALARCFHAPVAEEVEYLVREGYAARTSAAAKAAYLATLRDIRRDIVEHAPDYRRALATLDPPVLLIHGQQDRVIAPLHCGDAAEALPRARVRWIDACGHFPQIEHASVVNGWVTEFLVGRPAPR